MLDCSDFPRARQSVAAVLKIPEPTLAEILSGALDINPQAVDVGVDLWARTLDAGAVEPALPYPVRWFHVSRTLSPGTFHSLGILRAPEAVDLVWTGLRTLVPDVSDAQWARLRSDMESGEEVAQPSAVSRYRLRVSEAPEITGGIHGYLIRDVALDPPETDHDYTLMPETVEDIVSCAPAAWCLGERFAEAARLTLVHFCWPTVDTDYLRSALAYLWSTSHGGSLDDLTDAVDTRQAVAPACVVEVEEI